MGLLDGKVIFITGAARGQGRAHAVTAAREGADVVLLDVCGQIDGMRYQLATEEDLAKTRKLVEEQGRRAITVVGDVRDQGALDSAVALGIEEFGQVDGAIANAGVWDLSPPAWEITEELYTVVVDTVRGGCIAYDQGGVAASGRAPHRRHCGDRVGRWTWAAAAASCL